MKDPWVFSITGLAVVFLFGVALYAGGFGSVSATNPEETQGHTAILTPLVEASATTSTISAPHVYEYVEVTSGCGPYFGGTCAVIRSGPSTNSPVVFKARIGMVLKVGAVVVNETGTWYKITFDEWLRYPERISSAMYINASVVEMFEDRGTHTYGLGVSLPTDKYIIVDRSDQALYAYDGDTLFMKERISTGLELTPTPRGTFTIYRKTPSRYMQGPLPGISDQYYDLPGVPWNLYFSLQGAVIHGAYWHDKFGQQWSHGCVNVATDMARILYEWADVGTTVYVRD